MTDAVVLDSSAILALLNDEPGAEKVEAVLDRAIVGAVNLAEVAAKLSDKGLTRAEIEETLALFHDVRPMSKAQALATGMLRAATRSLASRWVIGLALHLQPELGTRAMTCDGAWGRVGYIDSQRGTCRDVTLSRCLRLRELAGSGQSTLFRKS